MQTEVYRSDIHAEDVSQASPAIVWELPDVLADDFMPWRHPLLESLRQAEDRCFSPAFTCVLAPDGFVLTHVGDEVLEIDNSGLSGLAAPGSSLTLNYVTVGDGSSVWLNMGSSIEQADFKIYESEEVARILDAAGGYGITVYDANGMRVNVGETASVSPREVNLYAVLGVIFLIVAGVGLNKLSKIKLREISDGGEDANALSQSGGTGVFDPDLPEYHQIFIEQTAREQAELRASRAADAKKSNSQVESLRPGVDRVIKRNGWEGEGHENDGGFAAMTDLQNDTLPESGQVIGSDHPRLGIFNNFVLKSSAYDDGWKKEGHE